VGVGSDAGVVVAAGAGGGGSAGVVVAATVGVTVAVCEATAALTTGVSSVMVAGGSAGVVVEFEVGVVGAVLGGTDGAATAARFLRAAIAGSGKVASRTARSRVIARVLVVFRRVIIVLCLMNGGRLFGGVGALCLLEDPDLR
jgi:hypothetical protein